MDEAEGDALLSTVQDLPGESQEDAGAHDVEPAHEGEVQQVVAEQDSEGANAAAEGQRDAGQHEDFRGLTRLAVQHVSLPGL